PPDWRPRQRRAPRPRAATPSSAGGRPPRSRPRRGPRTPRLGRPVGAGVARPPCALPRVDERIKAAVEQRLAVPGLQGRPVVFDQRVRVEDVRSDLIAPGGVAVLPAQGGELLLLLLVLQFVEPRLEQFHRGELVGVLRALVLTLHDDPGGHVGNAHRRLYLVHVLAAGAAGAVGIDPQIVL